MITVSNLNKVHKLGKTYVEAVKSVNLIVKKGEFVAIMGPSGSGKSTLMNLISLIEDPTKGKIKIGDLDVSRLTDEEKTRFRLDNMGYIFQDFNLLPELTALENTYLPALIKGKDKDRSIVKTKEILIKVGLGKRMNHLPSEMSGGQQQRVAIARALVNDPKILFADEPTANLDSMASEDTLKLFQKLNKEMGITIVLITHELEERKYADRVIWLKDGLLERIEMIKDKIQETKADPIDRLTEFIRKSMDMGARKEVVVKKLTDAGWKKDMVNSAIERLGV